MSATFFSSWEVHTTGICTLIHRARLNPDLEVWNGADGGFAVGDSTDIYEADPDTDLDHWTYAGTVQEYLDAYEARSE